MLVCIALRVCGVACVTGSCVSGGVWRWARRRRVPVRSAVLVQRDISECSLGSGPRPERAMRHNASSVPVALPHTNTAEQSNEDF